MDWLVLLIAVVLTLNNSLLIKCRILFGFTSQYSVPFIGANIIINFNTRPSIDHNLSSACTNVEQDRISSNIDELSLRFEYLFYRDKLVEAIDFLLDTAKRDHPDIRKDLRILRRRVYANEKDRLKGIINYESYTLERNKHAESLLEISDNML